MAKASILDFEFSSASEIWPRDSTMVMKKRVSSKTLLSQGKLVRLKLGSSACYLCGFNIY